MIAVAEEIWADLKEFAQNYYTPSSFSVWFGQARLEDIDLTNNRITIYLPSDTVREKWQKDLEPKLIEFTYKYTGKDLEPYYRLPNVYQEDTTLPSTDSTISSHEFDVRGTPLNANYTFENFVTGPNNQMAQAGALAISEQLGTLYNPFIIHGGTGLGKTHLMQAIGHEVLKRNPNIRIMNVSCEKFINDFIESLRKSGKDESLMQKFREKYRTVDLLLIDDVQFLENKEETQNEFFHTFNELALNQKQIVMTSDRPIDKIPKLNDRLVSRFKQGTSCDVTLPDFETRVAILHEKVELKKLNIPKDTIEYIANLIDSNVRELEGALAKLQLYASANHNEAITPTIAAKALRNSYSQAEHEELSILTIQETVASFYNITLNELKGKKRVQSILIPRQVAMYLARELTDNSLPKIGEAFGGKDHTTVMNACDRIKTKLKDDQSMNNDIQELKNLLLY